ncbi:low molecular weight phosphatase family protein [Paludisphaera rhizosphaerae]|uniref:hypothetical protein n=1 Tax=Paludisphaera rhizosphaerae TaxID=2711216 RepID=UPI001981E139|nr:hypothetical protein [Paludisphaera rhizosphaerae]
MNPASPPNATPFESRSRLTQPLRLHAERLDADLQAIAPRHHEAANAFARWIAEHYQPGEPLHAVVVCTGNSRRSILGSSMGNLAAAFYGMPEIRFHSGGTEPSAFNPRTVSALEAAGFGVEPTGAEKAPGNPEYRVSWGDGFEVLEFSKLYSDPVNPQEGFAALMVCNEADAGCPIVQGASARIPMPFDDPKEFDDQPYEAEKYTERRDEIGRVMLSVMKLAQELIARASAR